MYDISSLRVNASTLEIQDRREGLLVIPVSCANHFTQKKKSKQKSIKVTFNFIKSQKKSFQPSSLSSSRSHNFPAALDAYSILSFQTLNNNRTSLLATLVLNS